MRQGVRGAILGWSLLGSVLSWGTVVQPNEPVTALVNLNTASAQELQARLQGLGLARAMAIVTYRQQHGRFSHVDDLGRVNGFSPLTVARLRPLVTVD